MVRVDKLQLDIIINGDPVRAELLKLEKEARELKKSMIGIKDQELLGKKKLELEAINKKMEDLRHEIGLTGMTMKELQQRANTLKILLNNLPPDHAKYKEYKAELDQIKARMGELQGKAASAKLSLGKIADGMNRYFAMFGVVAAAVTGAVVSIKNFITSSAELTDELADIRKTTGMTAIEVAKLNKELGKMDTRTSVKDLRQIAIVAGQLGIAKDDVFDFVSSIDKLNIALSDEFEGGAREVAETVGKLRNVLGDMKTGNVASDLLRIGNALNTLGAAGFATSPVIADFANRIGGIGIPLGLTSDEVLGLSATLQELNVSTERGGTAVSKILQKMTQNTGDFAKIAGIPLKEFTDLVNTDLFGAFKKVLEGSKSTGSSATILSGIIKDLEVQGAGASEVFAKLSGNIGMMDEKVKLAGGALQGTDSIMNEFNIKNATLAATLDKLGKEFYKVIQMQGVQEFFKNMVYAIVKLVMALKELPQWIQRNSITLTMLTGVVLTYIAAKTKSIQVQLWNMATMKEGILLKAKDAIVMQYLIIKEGILTALKTQGTIATKAAAVAQYLWNAALSANPIGIIIMGITALVGAIKAYDKYNRESVRLEFEKAEALRQLELANKMLEKNYSDLSVSISQLNRLSIQEKQDLSDKIAYTLKLAEAKLIDSESTQKQIVKDNSHATLWQKIKNQVVWGAYVSIQKNLNAAIENGKKAGAALNDEIETMKKNIKSMLGIRTDIKEVFTAEEIADDIHTESIANMEEKLSKYQTALKGVVAGGADYIRIQGKIKALNKEMAKFAPDDSDVNKEKDRLKKALEDLEQVKADMIENERKRELAQEKNNLAKKLADIKGNTKAENELRELLKLQSKKKEKEINAKWDKDELKKEQDKYKAEIEALIESRRLKLNLLDDGSKDWEALQIQILEEERDLQLKNTELTEQQRKNIIEKYRQEIEGVTKKSGKRELAWEEQLNNLKEEEGEKGNFKKAQRDKQIEKDAQKKFKQALKDAGKDEKKLGQVKLLMNEEINKEIQRQDREAFKKKLQMAMDITLQITDAINTINKNNNDAELSNTLAKLDKQKEAELNTKNLTEEQKTAINEKYDKLARDEKNKAAKKQRENDIIMSVVNGAIMIAKGFMDGGWVGMALAAVAAAAQIAVIAAAPIPQYYSGLYPQMNVRGQNDGKTYNAGVINNAGTGMINKPAILVGEKPEMIVGVKDMKNPNILSHVNSILKLKQGLPEMNYPMIQQALKASAYPQYAAGLYPQKSTTVTRKEMFTDPDLVNAIKDFNGIMKEIKNDGLHAYTVMTESEKIQAKRDALKKNFNF